MTIEQLKKKFKTDIDPKLVHCPLCHQDMQLDESQTIKSCKPCKYNEYANSAQVVSNIAEMVASFTQRLGITGIHLSKFSFTTQVGLGPTGLLPLIVNRALQVLNVLKLAKPYEFPLVTKNDTNGLLNARVVITKNEIDVYAATGLLIAIVKDAIKRSRMQYKDIYATEIRLDFLFEEIQKPFTQDQLVTQVLEGFTHTIQG
jgi:ribosomal protein L37AE/L43A